MIGDYTVDWTERREQTKGLSSSLMSSEFMIRERYGVSDWRSGEGSLADTGERRREDIWGERCRDLGYSFFPKVKKKEKEKEWFC